MPEIAAPLARRTRRAAELIQLFGHGVGGRPGERLMTRTGMPTSDDTILRHLKRRAKERRAETSVRVVGIDDWAWRKGSTYRTIAVDLERREVIDVLPDRSTDGTAGWLEQHSDIEIVSRDRQVADRFHIFAKYARGHTGATEPRVWVRSSAHPLLPADADDERDEIF